MSINVDGREYASWAHVPPEIRARLAALPDKNGDGIPDVLQGDLSGLGDITTVSATTFAVNGVPYRSLSDLPEVLRSEMDRALRQLGALGSAVIDATSSDEPSAAGTGHAAHGAGHASTARPARSERPMMINGEPYDPQAGRKRWWQFWK